MRSAGFKSRSQRLFIPFSTSYTAYTPSVTRPTILILFDHSVVDAGGRAPSWSGADPNEISVDMGSATNHACEILIDIWNRYENDVETSAGESHSTRAHQGKGSEPDLSRH